MVTMEILKTMPPDQKNIVALALKSYRTVKTYTFEMRTIEFWRWPFCYAVQARYTVRHYIKLIWFWPARKLRKAGYIVLPEGQSPSWLWVKYLRLHK